MSASATVQATVRLQHTAGTVTGSVSVAGAPATGFYGWLELIALLDNAAERCGTGRTDRRDERSIREDT